MRFAGLITAFRMYEAGPGAQAAWRALFARVFDECAMGVRIVDHAWPIPIADLWAEPQLCCAFMCGWPFARSAVPMRAIAAPVPSPARYAGLARYCSEFLVREASGWRAIEETFGHRIGWMAHDSQSGFNAPRAFLAQFVTPHRASLYERAIGPLGTPATTLDALRREAVDVVPLDGYYLDLCRHHEPARLAGLRTVATTPWTPIPLLVAGPAIDRSIVERLRDRLLRVHHDPEYRGLLRQVLLDRFVAPDVDAYRGLQSMADAAVASGYDTIR